MADRPIEEPEGPVLPVPSCVSTECTQSMELPKKSRKGPGPSEGRSTSPVPTIVSMKSEQSMVMPIEFGKGPGPHEDRSTSPVPTIVSMKSEQSMVMPIEFGKGPGPHEDRSTSPVSTIVSMKSEQSMVMPIEFGKGPGPHEDSELSVVIPEDFQKRPHKERCDIYKKAKSSLKEKFQYAWQKAKKQENFTFSMDMYTELYITEEESKMNTEHEVHLIEKTLLPSIEYKPIECYNIFKQRPGQNKPVKSVLTKGVAGIGKTVSVQRFVLDWAEEKANEDIDFIFPLPFRELNLMTGNHSLTDIIHSFFPEVEESKLCLHEHKVVFIFDGLDECRLYLDFQNNTKLSNTLQPSTVDVIVTNLILGNLLPSALIWITSRPAAAHLVPPSFVDRVTEVRGFNSSQKAEFFQKKIPNQKTACNVFEHLKSVRSLYFMCHVPLFCWISATVLEKLLGNQDNEEVPKTLTEMYTHFVTHQLRVTRDKYRDSPFTTEDILFKLGELAYRHLRKSILIFYEEDLTKSGIRIEEAAMYSGLCTRIFRKEFGLSQKKVYAFVHLTIQEYLAALFVFLTFKRNGVNVLDQDQSLSCSGKTLSDLHKHAVDEALQSEHGVLDLFLRFLLGLSVQSNQALIAEVMGEPRFIPENIDVTAKYIKDKIRQAPSPEKCINLFHCLNELMDCSLVKEIQSYLSSGILSKTKLSPSQQSALVFVLLTSEEELKDFDLRRYAQSDDGLKMLLPVVKASRKATLQCCGLTEKSCAILDSALKSGNLKELHLSHNYLQDCGIEQLCSALKHSSCKLETLGLSYCSTKDKGFFALASYLRSDASTLKELDLNYSKPGEEGFRLFCEALTDPNCILEKLQLYSNRITSSGCEYLASALKAESSCLRELNLGFNDLQDSGMHHLCAGLGNPHCKLEILRLYKCEITEMGCKHLAAALKLNPCHLKELNLSHNWTGDNGVQHLSTILQSPLCKLERLNLTECKLTEKGIGFLAEALKSNPSHLKELDLSYNDPGDSGLQELLQIFRDPHCKLENIRLKDCNLTKVSCEFLASILGSECSSLRELDLSENELQDSGLRSLCAGLKAPHCKLQILRLFDCGLTEKICDLLASVLTSGSSLTHVDLSNNRIAESGMRILSTTLENPNCHLKTLMLYNCQMSSTPEREFDLSGHTSKEGLKRLRNILKDSTFRLERIKLNGGELTENLCKEVTLALKTKSLGLKELDLSNNSLQDSEIQILAEGLGDPCSELEILRMANCSVTERGNYFLGSAMKSNPANLKELDLCGSNPGDTGFKILSECLGDPSNKLERLILKDCRVIANRCVTLATALQSNPGHLKELCLSDNDLGLAGIECLADLLKHSVLEKLELSHCGITEEGCATLCSGLRHKPSPLKELDISMNAVEDSGIKTLSLFLQEKDCQLEKLNLNNCNITASSCSILASVLSMKSLSLKDLYLSENNLEDSGVKSLALGIRNPYCKLETLRLLGCSVTRWGFACLGRALMSNPTYLKKLDLTKNKSELTHVRKLLEAIQDPQCKLEELGLGLCHLDEKSCTYIAQALSSSTDLRTLDLSHNKLQDIGVQQLSKALGKSTCNLEKLRLSYCHIRERGFRALALALKSNSCKLRELDVTGNNPGAKGERALMNAQQHSQRKLKIVL